MPYEIKQIKRIEAQGMGALQFFEAERDIPFQIKRFYYISDVLKGIERGSHAHKRLQQFLFCPYGEVNIKLDDGTKKTEINLNRPDIGILLTPCIWREMVWHKDNSVLCVAVSDFYDPNDYIRDHDEFVSYVSSLALTGEKNIDGGKL